VIGIILKYRGILMHTNMDVLLIIEDESSLRLIEAMLCKGGYAPERVHCHANWQDGMGTLKNSHERVIAMISTEYNVKNEFAEQIRSNALEVPMLLLHDGNVSGELEADCFSLGVQEVLALTELSIKTLLKALRNAVERHRMRRQIHELSMLDELTGIYNRQGFLLRAEQTLALSERLGTEANLFFLDADHMKWVNDTYGHQEGDFLLKEISRILQDVFRRTDVLGRIGGDEFAVLALRESADDVQSILARLEESQNRVNAQRSVEYPITFSIGVGRSTREDRLDLDELMEIADQAMYENKKTKRGEGPTVKE
jgi:diguanylate cyclase (GGDEF)-like protein